MVIQKNKFHLNKIRSFDFFDFSSPVINNSTNLIINNTNNTNNFIQHAESNFYSKNKSDIFNYIEERSLIFCKSISNTKSKEGIDATALGYYTRGNILDSLTQAVHLLFTNKDDLRYNCLYYPEILDKFFGVCNSKMHDKIEIREVNFNIEILPIISHVLWYFYNVVLRMSKHVKYNMSYDKIQKNDNDLYTLLEYLSKEPKKLNLYKITADVFLCEEPVYKIPCITSQIESTHVEPRIHL